VGPFQIAKYIIPELRRRKGRIINVSSGAAHHPIEAAIESNAADDTLMVDQGAAFPLTHKGGFYIL